MGRIIIPQCRSQNCVSSVLLAVKYWQLPLSYMPLSCCDRQRAKHKMTYPICIKATRAQYRTLMSVTFLPNSTRYCHPCDLWCRHCSGCWHHFSYSSNHFCVVPWHGLITGDCIHNIYTCKWNGTIPELNQGMAYNVSQGCVLSLPITPSATVVQYRKMLVMFKAFTSTYTTVSPPLSVVCFLALKLFLASPPLLKQNFSLGGACHVLWVTGNREGGIAAVTVITHSQCLKDSLVVADGHSKRCHLLCSAGSYELYTFHTL